MCITNIGNLSSGYFPQITLDDVFDFHRMCDRKLFCWFRDWKCGIDSKPQQSWYANTHTYKHTPFPYRRPIKITWKRIKFPLEATHTHIYSFTHNSIWACMCVACVCKVCALLLNRSRCTKSAIILLSGHNIRALQLTLWNNRAERQTSWIVRL